MDRRTASPDAFSYSACSYDDLLARAVKSPRGRLGYYAEVKARVIHHHLRGHPRTALDFGCGTGRLAGAFSMVFPSIALWGCDISQASLTAARESGRYRELFVADRHSGNRFLEVFDLVMVAGVFHHIPRSERQENANLIWTLMKPGGELFVFEHNPISPLARLAVNSCAFDKGVALLWPKELKQLLQQSGLRTIRKGFTLFFPAQWKALFPVERFLDRIPLGAQYYIHARKPEANSLKNLEVSRRGEKGKG